MLSILAVDDDPSALDFLEVILGKQSYNFYKSGTIEDGLKTIKQRHVDIVLLDINFGNCQSGFDALKEIREIDGSIKVVMLSAIDKLSSVKEALKLGATDYICKPIDTDNLIFLLKKIEIRQKLEKENLGLRARLARYENGREIIHESVVMKTLLQGIERLKGHEDLNVLIIGETGTGKELVARRLHNQENDPSRPFIPVNCAAIPETLLESTLFGYEKSSYTGADRSQPGKFELADGGDIFLDEISTLSHNLQAKLLRVIQEREVERVGGLRAKKVSFRVIAASNKDMQELIKKGSFREDLFYRLNGVSIRVPPLRERREDIPLLADFFASRHTCRKEIISEVKSILVKYNWPGNVRQLEHVISSMLIFSKGSKINACDIPDQIMAECDDGVFDLGATTSTSLEDTIQGLERHLLKEAIKKTSNMRKAAESLKMKPTTFYSRVNKYGLREEKG